MEDNVVNRLQIELEAPALKLALRAQDWFSARGESTLAEAIERCPRSSDWERHVIDRLEVDLGSIELSDLGDTLVDRLAAVLQDELSSLTFERYGRRVDDEPLPMPTRVLYFLEHGTLPWWSRRVSLDGLASELVTLAGDKPALIRTWFARKSAKTVALALRRSSLQLGDATTRRLLSTIAPRSVEFGAEIVARLATSLDPAEVWAAIALLVHSNSSAESDLEAGDVHTWLWRVLQGFEPSARSAVQGIWETIDREIAGLVHEKRIKSRPSGSGDEDSRSSGGTGQSSVGRRSVDEARQSTNPDDSMWLDDDCHTREKSPRSAPDPTRSAKLEIEGANIAPSSERDTDRPQQGGIEHAEAASAESSTRDPVREEDVGRSGIDSNGSRGVDFHGDSTVAPDVQSTGGPISNRRMHDRDEELASISANANVPLPRRVSLDSESSDIRPGAGTEPALAVDNAGLVLLWPFLGELFHELGYRNADGWSTDRHQQRAIHLLQWMATGEYDCTPEYMLSLNKVLAGLDLEAPVSSEIVLENRERREADDLLRAVIQHWSMLKSTSINGLRGSFLIRPGLLEHVQGRIRLRVEGTAFDVLLEHLPWGLELVQLSWMQKPLEVQWWSP